MTGSFDNFPETLAAIQHGIDRRLHTALQICVNVRGQNVLNDAHGLAAPQIPATRDTVMLWRSAGKPLTALLILKRIEQAVFSLDSQVCDLIPPAAQSSSSAMPGSLTIRQLLTHTGGIPTVETGWPHADWDHSIRTLLSSQFQFEPGTAAYHPQSSWFLLGEILRRTSAHPDLSFSAILQTELLDPLLMVNTTCGSITGDEVPEAMAMRTGQLATIYERTGGELTESLYNAPEYRSRPSPGGSLMGPVSDLCRFYEVLHDHGRLADGSHFVEPGTISQMVQRQRIGLFDQTLQHNVDFGFGVIVNSNRYGIHTVPYGFGRFASEKTFGHGGAQCSMAFCDPENEITVAWAANGFCGEGQHQRRNRTINEAIYVDLANSQLVKLPAHD
ncbi:MAG: beta-lactamase family protein [Planctomycetaceae bacterium]|nr:beta-lactamase family protein [Planctomycetaceae bacterium]